MMIMQCRKEMLESALRGLDATNISLISSAQGSYFPAGFTDDPGIYYFIPAAAKILGISISFAIDLFFGFLLFFGSFVSLTCFFSLFKHFAARWISAVGIILLTYCAYKFSDVYIAAFFAVTTILPISLVLSYRQEKIKTGLFFAFSGLVIGYCNLLRSHSGTGMALYLLLWLLLQTNFSLKTKLFHLLILSAFLVIPNIHFLSLVKARDHFLVKQNPSYTAPSIIHPRWHNIYIGFGYLPNHHGIEYDDSVSNNKALSINPKVVYCSTEYEEILKNACFDLFREDPWFVIRTILSKILKIFSLVLLFANVGVILVFFYVKPTISQILPYLFSGAFYALPGILTMPIKAYVSGLISLVSLFGIYMICLAVQKFKMAKMKVSIQSN